MCRSHPVPERFGRRKAKGRAADDPLALSCCVDSVVTRRLIWVALCRRAGVFVAGLLSAEVIRVPAADPPTEGGS